MRRPSLTKKVAEALKEALTVLHAEGYGGVHYDSEKMDTSVKFIRDLIAHKEAHPHG